MTDKLELLAPAGSVESFYAAVNSGANAVYLGGKSFSARQYSNNFDKDELTEIVKYAHNKDVKIYVTVNTILKDAELYQALDYVYFLYEIDVDAVIVQDLGLIYLINKYIPDLKINVSTQATIYDKYGVEFFDYPNINKYILSRELSLEEISEIASHTTKNIETFIHGALCMSYSGQCYFSSFLGGRSGNRGKCAQPCRLNYSFIYGKTAKKIEKYKDKPLLSLKDFKAGKSIKNLINAGVKTFKIEGRMKSPEYSATVVEYYRYLIDNAIDKNEDVLQILENKVESIFNRGYTNGYLNSGKENMFAGVSTGSFGEKIDEIIQEASEKYYPYSAFRRNKVNFILNICRGKKVELVAEDDKNKVIVYSEEIVEESQKNPVTDKIVMEQLEKLGNTTYSLGNVQIHIDDNSFVRKSTVNQLRRDAINLLYEKRGNYYGRKPLQRVSKSSLYNNVYNKRGNPSISLKINSISDLKLIKNGRISRLYIPYGFDYEKIREIQGIEKLLYIPNVVGKDFYINIMEEKEKVEDIFDGVCVNNIGSFYFFKDNFNLKIHCGYFFNIINSFNIIALREKGANSIMYSVESNIKDIENMCKYTDVDGEIYAHGYLQLMTMRNCPFSVLKGCNGKGDCRKCEYSSDYKLKDRINVEFNILRNNGLSFMYNSVPLTVIGRTKDFVNAGVKYFFIDTLFVDNPERYIDAIYDEMQGKEVNVDMLLKQNEFTRGHYFKNVL